MLVNISDSWPGAKASGGALGLLEPTEGVKPDRQSEWVAPEASSITIRSARISDMAAVEALIRPFAAMNLMLPKSSDQLARNFREFVVATDGNGRIVGCGALRVYNEELAEVASLAVDDRVQKLGVGRKIVDQLVVNSQELGLRTVFALTLNPAFFGRLGFSVVPRDDFPLKVWADCRNCPKLHACDEIAVARSV